MSKTKTKFSFLILLILSLCLSAFMFIGQPVTASAADNNYIAADGTEQLIPENATQVESSTATWATGWYVVEGNVEITGDILIVGEVNLVLKEGCSLTITGTINADSGNTLVIYGQSEGTGTMNVEVNGESEYVAVDVGELIINGGTVNVTTTCLGKSTTYGILCDRLSIKGGAVNVSATQSAANLGSATGIYGRESVEISGGTVYVSAKQPERDAYGIDSPNAKITGGTVTLNVAGRDSENTSLFYGALSVEDSGTLVLPSTMSKNEILALGITGTGGIKFGNAHIGTDGNCITHNWDARIKQKDTTQHYTMGCRTCNINDEATVAACEYDNVCDTDCDICGIVRTITHQYDENGFCTICRYSDTPAVDSDGDGYVEINTAGKLWWFTHQVNNGRYDLNAELTANIDLSGTCGEGIGNWLPISHEEGYAGKFNGQGYTISNLYMGGNEQYAGLFGYVKGATIENVRVTGSVSSTFFWTYDPDTYENFEGMVGGIVAHLDGGTIRICESDVTVTGGLEFGGICGRLSSGIIEDCINRGTIIRDLDSTDVVYYGGIVGYMRSGTVRGCTNHYGVSGAYADIGGIVGNLSEGTVENCINLSNIAGTQKTNAGGIAGKLWIYGAIRNCGNLGTVTGDYAGGITGCSEGDIAHCWNIASVSGTSEYVGPIAGYISTDYGNITSNYYLSDTTTEDGGRTAEQFASGQVAYELNGSTTTDESIWKQTLGTDNYPTLTGDNVYYVASKKCDGTVIGQIYSNSSEEIIEHVDYIDQIAEKDATHHYTHVCSICSKGNEETTAKHTFVDGVCTLCSYACTHSDADSDCLCDICNVALTHKDENSDYLCEVCGSLFDTKAFFDPDLWAYMLSNFDADNNGSLSPTEIASVTSVDLRGINVIKISGIEHFSNLTEIKCDIDMLWYTMSYDLSISGIDISKVTVESGAVIGDLNGKTVLLIGDGESTVVGTYALFENSTPIALTMSILAPHTHTYEDVVWPDFVKTPATCSTGTIYYKSCECGRISDETFENVDRNLEIHGGTDNVYFSNDNGTHNIVWSCCNAVSLENDICVPLVFDKSCLTAEICECKYVIKAAATGHDFSDDYLYDTEGHWHKCKNCSVTDSKEKHSARDDGSCLTAALCSCGTIVIDAKDDHSFDNACDTDCNNAGCTHTRTTEHRPEADDNDCTTDILCSICDAVTTKGNESHTGGTATCQTKALCTKCGKEYGELDVSNHSKTTFIYMVNEDGTTHTKKYECCELVVADNEAHAYGTEDRCVCGVEEPKVPIALIVTAVSASVALLGGGGFALWWFVFRKKKIK